MAIAILGKNYLNTFVGLESNILRNTFTSHVLFVVIFTIIVIHRSLLDVFFQLVCKDKVAELWSSPGLLLLFGCIFHTLSLSSSSFIEEEHQTWYYFNNSWFLLITLIEIRLMNCTIIHFENEGSNEVLLSHYTRKRGELCVSAGLFFIGHIILRRWNQTGDKWQHIPDIGDWFGKVENKPWLSLILFLGKFDFVLWIFFVYYRFLYGVVRKL